MVSSIMHAIRCGCVSVDADRPSYFGEIGSNFSGLVLRHLSLPLAARLLYVTCQTDFMTSKFKRCPQCRRD